MLRIMETPTSTSPPMSPEDGRRLARHRVWARKQRSRGIRRRVAAITLSLFVAAWVAMFARMVTGHDPALGATSQPAKATNTSPTSQGSTTATQAAAAKTAAAARAKAQEQVQASKAAASAAATAAAESAAANTSAGASGTNSASSSSSGSSASSSSAAPVTTKQS